MNTIEISLIALGLAMDAFAVSLANGVIIKNVKISHALTFGLYFGSFQCGMALLGWLAGRTFASYLSRFGPWIAFILLAMIGCNMIIEGVKRNKNGADESSVKNEDILKWSNMSMLAVATSIDALAIGVSLAIVNTYIVSTSIIIGLFAFILSLVGVLIGNKLNKVFKKNAEIVGGVILLIIAIKILIESFL